MTRSHFVLCLGMAGALTACRSNLLPGKIKTTTALSADTHDAFPIDAASHHPGTDCNSCHGDFATFSQFTCLSGCHAQATVDPIHDGLEGYRYDSVTCLQCHPNGTADGTLAAHPFPIDTTAVHTGVACRTCHLVTGDRSQFSCTTGCHEETVTTANHTGVADYGYDSAKCLNCHPQGIADVAINHTAFPIGAGTAHVVGCSQCHTDRSQPANPANFKCGTCHSALDSAFVTKHTTTASTKVKASEFSTTDSRTCLRCHAEAQIDVSASKPHSNSAPYCGGNEGRPPHHNAGCTNCHSSYRADKTYAGDFSMKPPPGCAQCHENGQLCH